MTTLTYGPILLINVLTREFSQVPVRDESNTDTWYYKFTYRCSSLVNIATFNANLPPVIGAWKGNYSSNSNIRNAITAADAMALINANLAVDRQAFTLAMTDGIGNSTILLGSGPAAGDQSNVNPNFPDVNNGPKVIELRTTQVSPATIQVEFGVEVSLSGCSENPHVLGNRWSQIDDYDESYRRTTVYRGKLRMATNDKVTLADLRNQVMPPLVANFKRERMHFEQSMSGLELGYEVQDREMLGAAPPSPAIRMKGTHTESFGPDGIKADGSLSVRLDGTATSSKNDLLQRAMDITFRKIQLPGFNADANSTTFLTAMVVGNHFSDDENAIEVATQYIRTGSKGSQAAGAGQLATITQPMSLLGIPAYDVSRAVKLDGFGTAGTAGTVATILAHGPCSNHTFGGTTASPSQTKKGDQSGSASDGTEGDIPTTISIVNTLSQAFQPLPYSDVQTKKNPYVFHQVDIKRKKKYHRIMLPKAKSQNPDSEAPDSTSAVKVSLGPATSELHVKVASERYNNPVELIQDIDFKGSDGINYFILNHDPQHRPPRPMGDGNTVIFSADAEYIWGMDQAPKAGTSLSVASLPWTTSSIAQDSAGQTFPNPTDSTKGFVQG